MAGQQVEIRRANREAGYFFASYAENAVAAFYIMTRRLLALYERGDLSMLVDLQKSI
jgi:hypothetical protein